MAAANAPERPNDSELPKNQSTRWWMLLALLGVIVAGAAMAWGFVAPAVNPGAPPVQSDGELPVD